MVWTTEDFWRIWHQETYPIARLKRLNQMVWLRELVRLHIWMWGSISTLSATIATKFINSVLPSAMHRSRRALSIKSKFSLLQWEKNSQRCSITCKNRYKTSALHSSIEQIWRQSYVFGSSTAFCNMTFRLTTSIQLQVSTRNSA